MGAMLAGVGDSFPYKRGLGERVHELLGGFKATISYTKESY
jgi:hypothetical protein